MSKRVLLTGATGLIGRFVAKAIDGSSELLLTSSAGQTIPEGKTTPFDLLETDRIANWLDTLGPEVIVHTAAVTSIDQAAKETHVAKRLNVDATEAIANWCASRGARLIHFSSDFVFDGKRKDVKEEDTPNPLSWYGKTKLESERVVREALEDHVIIRPILVYGQAEALSRLNFPLMVAAKLSAGQGMKITADQYRMPTYADDIAQAVGHLISSDIRGTLHLAGPDYVSVMEFAQIVAEEFNLDPQLLEPVTTSEMFFSGERPMLSGFDTSLASKVLDWDPTPIRDALHKMKIKAPS